MEERKLWPTELILLKEHTEETAHTQTKVQLYLSKIKKIET